MRVLPAALWACRFRLASAVQLTARKRVRSRGDVAVDVACSA